MSPRQSATSQWDWGFHTLRGGIDPGDLRFRTRVVGAVDVWKDFSSGDGNPSSPGCAGSMYDPQPVSNRPVGLGFPHRAGRFRPGESPSSSPGCRSCKGIEVFLIRGWEPIFPGVRWFHVRSRANQRSACGAEVSTPCEAVSTRRISVYPVC